MLRLRPPSSLLAALALWGVHGSLAPTPATGQADPDWNGPRALELVERARELRRSLVVDSALQTYRSDARGFVYFFLDRQDSDERTLVKTDQVALEVFWRAPGDTRQRIVGLRDEKTLPTNIQYHLDHLTVVQDEFGDRIRLGDGDEVESVPHPVGAAAEQVYDYRLADSLTLEFGGPREPVRVYELEVRPRDLERPGFVGSVYLDRATAAIVRMTFTFTPASYVDPYLDYIRISLDNGLWLGRFWLPYRQEAELRRELPQLDFMAGSVIRGRFEIRNYTFNEPLPDRLFASRTVLAVPEAERRAFPFEEPIFAGLEAEGLDPSASMEDLTAQARRIVRDQALSGLRPARFYWSSVSDAARYNRSEGAYLGTGTSVRLPLDLSLRLHGGWSFGRDDITARAELAGSDRRAGTRITAAWRTPRDIGPVDPSSRLFNSLASLAGEDWSDLYFVSGVEASHRLGPPDGLHATLVAAWEDHRSATLAVDDIAGVYRPVRPIEDGVVGRVGTRITWPAAWAGVDLRGRLGAAHLHERTWFTGDIEIALVRTAAWSDVDLDLRARAGFASGDDPPPQAFFLLGGRGTLPGHDHRTFVGDRYWLADARVGRTLVAPWFGLHLTGAVGQAWVAGFDRLPTGWTGDPDAGVHASVGVGADLLWEVVTVDVARGLGSGGEWAFMIGVNPRFHPWL